MHIFDQGAGIKRVKKMETTSVNADLKPTMSDLSESRSSAVAVGAIVSISFGAGEFEICELPVAPKICSRSQAPKVA